jgi:pilus assembly protein Flp/PilA
LRDSPLESVVELRHRACSTASRWSGRNDVVDLRTRFLAREEDQEGQGLAEYALILALIAIVAILALIFLGTQISGILSTVGDSL